MDVYSSVTSVTLNHALYEAKGNSDGRQTHNPLLGLHNQAPGGGYHNSVWKVLHRINSCLLCWSENTLIINSCIIVVDCWAFGCRGCAENMRMLKWFASLVTNILFIIIVQRGCYISIKLDICQSGKLFFPSVFYCLFTLSQLCENLSLVFSSMSTF